MVDDINDTMKKIGAAGGKEGTGQAMTRALLAFGLLGVVSVVAAAQGPRTHELPLAPANVHWGYYDASIKPVLRVASGDPVRLETMVARGVQR
jgi:hypothetical protein